MAIGYVRKKCEGGVETLVPETTAGPSAGTVRKLSFDSNIDYAVPITQNETGEGYVGISGCCSLSFNPTTGTLTADKFCGEASSTDMATCVAITPTCQSLNYKVPFTCDCELYEACSQNMIYNPSSGLLSLNCVNSSYTTACRVDAEFVYHRNAVIHLCCNCMVANVADAYGLWADSSTACLRAGDTCVDLRSGCAMMKACGKEFLCATCDTTTLKAENTISLLAANGVYNCSNYYTPYSYITGDNSYQTVINNYGSYSRLWACKDDNCNYYFKFCPNGEFNSKYATIDCSATIAGCNVPIGISVGSCCYYADANGIVSFPGGSCLVESRCGHVLKFEYSNELNYYPDGSIPRLLLNYRGGACCTLIGDGTGTGGLGTLCAGYLKATRSADADPSIYIEKWNIAPNTTHAYLAGYSTTSDAGYDGGIYLGKYNDNVDGRWGQVQIGYYDAEHANTRYCPRISFYRADCGICMHDSVKIASGKVLCTQTICFY